MRIEWDSFSDWDAFPPEVIARLMTRGAGVFLIAEYDGVMAGYLCLTVSRRHNTGRVYSLAVSPVYRGRGVADALMERAIVCARDKALRTVFLEVRTDNFSAIRLYEKKGFRRRYTKRFYYSDGDPAYYMALPICEG
jgi:ribosomal-protein-alanine N-acetyltransferase